MDTKTLCLGVLYGGEASGYEIKKQCEDGPFGQFWAAGFGSIYPALTALCEDGYVSVREQQQQKRPDKKVYSITAAGRAALMEAIATEPARDRVRSDFMFKLFLGELMPAASLDAMIDDRLAWLRARLDEMRSRGDAARPPGAAFVLGIGMAIHQAQIDFIEANRGALAPAREAEGALPALPPAAE